MNAARIANVAGVIASVAFLLHSAGQGAGVLLKLVMIAWVTAPFVALDLGRRLLARAFPILSWAITLASLALYAADAVRPFNSKAAFVFVAVPLGAWAAIVITSSVAWIRT
jgi:hypothetical protein